MILDLLLCNGVFIKPNENEKNKTKCQDNIYFGYGDFKKFRI